MRIIESRPCIASRRRPDTDMDPSGNSSRAATARRSGASRLICSGSILSVIVDRDRRQPRCSAACGVAAGRIRLDLEDAQSGSGRLSANIAFTTGLQHYIRRRCSRTRLPPCLPRGGEPDLRRIKIWTWGNWWRTPRTFRQSFTVANIQTEFRRECNDFYCIVVLSRRVFFIKTSMDGRMRRPDPHRLMPKRACHESAGRQGPAGGPAT